MLDTKNNAETLDKIVESAVILFNKDGYSGASISNIATHAGVAKGNLYYYFKSKDEFYLHCAKKCIGDIREYINQNIKDGNDNELMAIELLKLRIRFFEINPDYRIFFLNILAKKPDHLSEQLREIRREFKEENLKLFMKYLSHIKLGNGVKQEDLTTFVSLLQNYTSLAVETFDHEKDYNEQAKAILRMATIFINGLREDIK